MEAVKAVMKAWERMMFQNFFTLQTITTKGYQIEESNKTDDERATLEANRFAGNQKLILAGLGTMFWGTATDVLSKVKKKLLTAENIADWIQHGLAHWVQNSFMYGAFALIFMLLALCASTIPTSSPLAAGMAGLGGWQAIVFILGTFHVASLEHYSNTEECVYSFLGAFAVITLYWGFAAQDPLLLHILVKSIMWVIVLPFFVACFVLYHLINVIMSFLRGILMVIRAVGLCLYSCGSSVVNALSYMFHLARGYRSPGQQQAQP